MATVKKLLASVVSPSCITVLSLMVLWGQIQNYMMRSNLSIIIVAMVKTTASNSSSSSDGGDGGSIVDSESCAMVSSVGAGYETKSGTEQYA